MEWHVINLTGMSGLCSPKPGAAAAAVAASGTSPITMTYVRNETDKLQTIWLPPGGKVCTRTVTY